MTTTTRKKKKTRVSNSTAEDRLSRLPEQILDTILCLLPQKESVRTCVLSKSWRHLGPCRSKLDLCRVTDFNGDIKKFKSVLYNTLEGYNRQNFFLKQLSLKMAPSHQATVRLNLPWIASTAQLLEQLYLERCNFKHINLNAHHQQRKGDHPLFKHLRKLSLVRCEITNEVLEVLLSSSIMACPLLEWLCINSSFGYKNLNVGNARRLKHFEVSNYHDLSSIVFDDVPKLETISIANCRHWCFLDNNNNYFPRLKSLRLKNVMRLSSETIGFLTSNYMPSLEKLELIDHHCNGCQEFMLSSSSINNNNNNNYFPRLKSLRLTCVRLSSETFNFFTSKYMPSLEKLELERCYGCQEFQLSSSSIKYLSIICFKGATKVTIDAPNLSCFKLKPYHPLPSLSFTPISSEWKSHVHLTTDVRNDRYDHSAPCLGIFHEIHRVLKSLSESQITLQLFLGNEYQRRILDAAHEGLYQDEPHVVEHLSLELGDYLFSTVQSMFGYLFHVCRPRYIYNAHIKNMSKGVTARILWKLLLHQREKMGYFWNQDLVEVSMESSSNFMNPKEWKSVPSNSLSECDINQNIRFLLKWRGM